MEESFHILDFPSQTKKKNESVCFVLLAYSKMNGHCTDYPAYTKLTISEEYCIDDPNCRSDLVSLETLKSDCQNVCSFEFSHLCAGFAIGQSDCFLYMDKCKDSNDGISWGYQFFKRSK